jgi:tRNA modification GTPase
VSPSDTIVALSSPATPCARIVLRLSGNHATHCARTLIESIAAPSATTPPIHGWEAGARRVRLLVRGLRFPAWAYVFRAPRSYTGEDVVELHIPGNPLLARMTIEDLLSAGARQAEPGEFTARAYFNGRLDLTAAEGVAALVSASNENELRAARQLLAGELARRLTPIMDRLAETLALLEVEIDFSDEEVTFLQRAEVETRLTALAAELQTLIAQSARFERLSHEPRIVLVGRPNAGKSTLLNALAGRQRAVVSPVAGTTRDVLSAEVNLPGGRVTVLDVAGIEEMDAPADEIERSMRERALRAVEEADVVVLVRDDEKDDLVLPRQPDLIVHTKADLRSSPPLPPGEVARPHGRAGEGAPEGSQAQLAAERPLTPTLSRRERGQEGVCIVSAWTGEGMQALRTRLSTLAFGPASDGSTLALNARHVQAIETATAALTRARGVLDHGPEVIALELRDALDALGSILGVVTPDELLGRIFSRFCIGK